jgi:hypothetical protein
MILRAFGFALIVISSSSVASLRDVPSLGLGGESSVASSRVKVDIDLSQTHDVAPNLYGIFFEEVIPRASAEKQCKWSSQAKGGML